jgi:predicted TIM-barrel fold metal-dependent hydrolase
MHVHIVGNGSAGTGCWIRVQKSKWLLYQIMIRHIGLPAGALQGDLDRLFAARLVQLVRESSLDAIVILAQEQVYHEDGRLMEGVGSAYVPNDYVLRLARENPQFLPAISIHPARPDALDELDRCLAAGAVMLKILPNCQNIDCNLARYRRFWERMAAAGLPLLAHTGGEHTLQVVRPDLADPRVLRVPLECGVNVIAAHCATKSGLFDPQYFGVLAQMFREHSNLYGDLSAFNVPIRGSVVPRCLREPALERMVHGSDFPVPVFGHWAWMQGFVSWRGFRAWENNPNILEKDYQLKRAMGFPEEVFTRINRLLRKVPV